MDAKLSPKVSKASKPSTNTLITNDLAKKLELQGQMMTTTLLSASEHVKIDPQNHKEANKILYPNSEDPYIGNASSEDKTSQQSPGSIKSNEKSPRPQATSTTYLNMAINDIVQSQKVLDKLKK